MITFTQEVIVGDVVKRFDIEVKFGDKDSMNADRCKAKLVDVICQLLLSYEASEEAEAPGVVIND